MNSGDAYLLVGAIGKFAFKRAVVTDRRFVLRYLKTFRKVGVEIILAGEDRAFAYLAIGRKSHLDDVLHEVLVEHRQCAGMPEADRTDVRIRRVAKSSRAGTECLRLRQHLSMNL